MGAGMPLTGCVRSRAPGPSRVPRAPWLCLSLLPALAAAEESEPPQEPAVVITATRTPTLVQDEPLHVEAVPAEEIEENLTEQPGNLSSLLSELPSVRVQSVAPALAGAGLQLRGMPARDTLMLSDGLPLLGAVPDAFGLLQTPPLDLERVEVIKGAASALYGGSALGGVLNLVSRSPASESGVLANATSRGGEDLEGFFASGANARWSATLTGGAHFQSRQDVDGDGWADIPGYRRFTARPRLWLDYGAGDSTLVTAGVVYEDRAGGTLPGRTLPGGEPFSDELVTRRLDAGAVSRWKLTDDRDFVARASVTSARADRTFGLARTPSTQTTLFAEAAWTGHTAGHSWAAGAAFARDQLSVASVPGVGYLYDVPGLFAQDEYRLAPWLTAAASARVDASDRYGTFLSPRLSALVRRTASPWSVRVSVGGGFAAPTPFVDEAEAAGLGSLLPLAGLRAERAVTAALDAKWAAGRWDLNASLFTSEIRDPLTALPVANEKLEITNGAGPRRAPGAEALIGYVLGALHAIASWSYVSATEEDLPGVRESVPLVPRHAAELGVILESEQRGRIGAEVGYTGRQTVMFDPYRNRTPAYLEVNALGELRIGEIAIFLNALNLTNVRQTHYDPLLLPRPGPGGTPITEAWAPLAGRTFNFGVRTD